MHSITVMLLRPSTSDAYTSDIPEHLLAAHREKSFFPRRIIQRAQQLWEDHHPKPTSSDTTAFCLSSRYGSSSLVSPLLLYRKKLCCHPALHFQSPFDNAVGLHVLGSRHFEPYVCLNFCQLALLFLILLHLLRCSFNASLLLLLCRSSSAAPQLLLRRSSSDVFCSSSTSSVDPRAV